MILVTESEPVKMDSTRNFQNHLSKSPSVVSIDPVPGNKEHFQQHIHIYRGIAIILIVCAHTVPSLDWSQHPFLGRFIDAIANQSSIFFFYIAGYLFQHLSKNFNYRKYLSQKAKTVILPYLILSIPALIVFTTWVQREGVWPWFYTLPVWNQILLFLLTGKHLIPLWFVPSISLLYLAAPLFLLIDRRAPRLYWIILPLFLLSVYIGRSHFVNPFGPALYLLPTYLLGMAFSHYRSRAELLVTKAKVWLPLVILTLFGLLGSTLSWSEPPYYFMVAKAPAALLLTVALKRWYGIFGNKLDYIAHISFGIFFVHAYFISAIKIATEYLVNGIVYKGYGSHALQGNLPIFFTYMIGVLLLSVGSLWIAQKLFGKRSRMIVGA